MFSKSRQSFLLCCLSIAVLTSNGCIALLVGGAAGAAAAVYIQGTLEKNFDYSLKDLHDVAIKTMKAEDIYVDMDEVNVHNAQIKGEYEDGEKVTVDIESLTEKSAKLKIRVGVFGDEVRSHELMKAIEKRL